MAGNKKNVLKNVTTLGLVQIANYVFPLVTIPIISRIIGPDKFGVLNFANNFMSYFVLLITYGFDLTATRKVARDPDNKPLRIEVFNKVFAAKMGLFILSLLLFVLSLYIVPPLAKEKQVALYSFLLCVSTLFTQNWMFQAMQDLTKVALLNFLVKSIGTFLVLYFVREKPDYIWQPLVINATAVLVSLVSFIWVIRKYELKLYAVPFRQILHMLWEEKTVFVSMVVISLYTTTNTVMLGLLENETQVGYYAAAQRLIAVATNVINLPLAQAFYPFIGKAFGEGKENGIRMVQRTLPMIMILTFSFGLMMFALGPIFMKWFYGAAFAPSVAAFQVISFVPFVVALSNVFGIQTMLNLHMDKLFFKITLIGACLGLALNYIMIRSMGFMGTAWNWLVVEIVITTLMYIAIKRRGLDPVDPKQFSFTGMQTQLRPIVQKLLRKSA